LFRLIFYLTLFLGNLSLIYGQAYNLVPNPSFELYEVCPDDHSQIELATGWQMWSGSPDFFNACGESNMVSTPLNLSHGFQPPLTGGGYGGLIGMTYNNFIEVMGIELLQPLEVNESYYIEFFWSRAFGGGFHHWCDCANSHLGALLTTEGYNSIQNPFQHSSFAHVYDDQLLVDSTDWQRISGWIIADQAYTHVGIGTFFNLGDIEVAYFNGTAEEILLKTYYYIDGVCVATDPAYCNAVLSQGEILKKVKTVNIYPNPANDFTRIQLDGPFTYRLMDIAGKKILSGNGYNNAILDLAILAHGTYIITIETTSGVTTKKIIKNP
jgi:hypothetical protein